MSIDTTNEVGNVISVSPSDSSDEHACGEDSVASPSVTPDIIDVKRERRPSSYGRKRKTIYTAGRPPWYNEVGEQEMAFVIGLSGGSASGKTTVAGEVIQSLRVPWVSLLSMDSFYKVLTPEQHKLANENNYDFDVPDAFDFDLLISTLRKLKEGKSVKVPIYDFNTHSRAKYTKTMYGANVVIFEGILAFTNRELLDLMDLKIFVDTDSDVRLARRLKRDIVERGRDLEGVLKQYNRFVKPSFHQFIEPSMKCADIVVPRGAENKVALKLIVNHIKDRLKKHGCKFRSKLINEKPFKEQLPEFFHILPNKSQVRGMHTVIRNKETKRDDFVFYTNRLACLVIEYSLSFLPFEEAVVDTPQGTKYAGKRFNGKLCGVAILRAGEVLEPALLSVCKDATIGKILIQTNQVTGEPELHFLRLPNNIADCYVLLMDATVATGAAAIMAIRILLDHDVPQDHILLVSLLSAQLGVHSVAYAFPEVKLITSAMDEEVNEDYHIIPGVGNYGDRYFGTEAEGLF